MDDIEAKARLTSMTAANSIPTLTSGELDDLVDFGRRADLYGRWPSDTDWVPTFDLNKAAEEGWMWKAGKTAGNFNYGTDGQSYERAQIHAQCLEMAAGYRRGVFVSVPITAWAGGYEVVLVESGTFGEPGSTFDGI